MRGKCGLFFTNSNPETVQKHFEAFGEADYATGGFTATETVELPEGPLTQFAHSIEPHLRKLGMPTELKMGVIQLRSAYTVCTKGEPISVDAAKILVCGRE